MTEPFVWTNCSYCGQSTKCLKRQIETTFERYKTVHICEECYHEKIKEEARSNYE
jgi:superfamily II helicase